MREIDKKVIAGIERIILHLSADKVIVERFGANNLNYDAYSYCLMYDIEELFNMIKHSGEPTLYDKEVRNV